MTLPNFVFIGPDKSGSSWLHKVLSAHPEIYLTPAKDTYFFDREYERGLTWYERFFEGAAGEAIVGEVCHDYLFDAKVPGRMKALLRDDLRLMVCLREPVERAFSAYLNMVKNGWEIGDFDAAVSREPGLLANGLYARHLAPFVNEFGWERILITVFDDLRSDPQGFLDQVTDWLKVSDLPLPAELIERERAASFARNQELARMVKRAATWARARGAAGLVGRIKRSPVVQRVLYREYGSDVPTLDAVTQDRYMNYFRSDIVTLSEMVGRDFAEKWGYR